MGPYNRVAVVLQPLQCFTVIAVATLTNQDTQGGPQTHSLLHSLIGKPSTQKIAPKLAYESHYRNQFGFNKSYNKKESAESASTIAERTLQASHLDDERSLTSLFFHPQL